MKTDKLYNYYLIPGLGFNAKTFEKLIEHLPYQASINYIEWIEPEDEDESLDAYIHRMSKAVDRSHDNIIFIGHSFGGVVSQELSQFVNAERVILISSIKSPSEMAWNLKVMKRFPAFKLVNHTIINNTFHLWAEWHDFKDEEQKRAFTEMVNKMSISYFRWAVDAILHWNGVDNRKVEPIHFHGDNDQTFYYNKIEKPITVKGGGHFMVFNRAEEICGIIKEKLEEEPKKSSIY